MDSQYAYTPFIWPMLAASMMLGGVGLYSWRKRVTPGALPLALLMFMAAPWALGAALRIAAVPLALKIFWIKYQALWLLPIATAGFWFAIEYANLTHRLGRRAIALLSIPALVAAALIITNNVHHLAWSGFAFNGHIRPVLGAASPFFIGYGLLLAIANSLIFVWLFVTSPLHRWPAGLCVLGQLAPRFAYVMETVRPNLVAPMDPTVLAGCFTAVMYTIALFRFRMLDLIPVARSTVIEQMREGMMVLDKQERIVDLNPAAEQILGVAAEARGRNAVDVLPGLPDLSTLNVQPDLGAEFRVEHNGSSHWYSVQGSPLQHRSGLSYGYLILLHEVTQEKLAHMRIVEQQRALATLEERDRLARELHDSLGQVLAFVKIQAEAVRLLVARRENTAADECLAKLVAVTEEANTDVREYILGCQRSASADSLAFSSTLQRYVQRFSDTYGIRANLRGNPNIVDDAVEPTVAVQLLRIIQEALTNVRKHAGADRVDICLGVTDSRVEATIQDDGIGFAPVSSDKAKRQTFGFGFMRERAEQTGGTVDIVSQPGEGTRVTIRVPLRK